MILVAAPYRSLRTHRPGLDLLQAPPHVLEDIDVLRDNHARGVTAYLVEAANSNVYRTLLELENNGQEFADLPELSKQKISNVKALVNKAKTAFSTNKIFGDNGAYKLALDAAIESSKFATTSGIVYEVESKVKISLPDWIKNTITWWSEGSISEQEFVGALQYLIKEKIMILPNIPESNQMPTGRAVPDCPSRCARSHVDGSD